MANEKDNLEYLEEMLKMVEKEIPSIDDEGRKELADLIKKASSDENFIKMKQEIENKQKEEAKRITDEIQMLLKSKEWHYTNLSEDGKNILLNFKMKNTIVRLNIMIEEDAGSIRYNALLPIECEKACRMLLADYLAVINQPLRYGAFHLDNEDGEISYRYSASYNGINFSPEVFEIHIDASLLTIDRYYREICRFATGRLNDEERKEYLIKIKELAIALSSL